ncbi:MAG: LysR family transcriptional regulator [Proteobacteria bacterium]|nr:MAG: LysR family transcriptional regulator [Pseudomonadota bacterium]
MNLDQLEAINAVATYGSFRSAAEKLHRSQPALSATIKQLEDEYGFLIFDRSQYRPRLTEPGAAFLRVARATLESAHFADRVALELGKNKAETKLCISVDPLISTQFIRTIAIECARPTLPVNLIIDKSILQGSHQSLLSGEHDLALAPRPKASRDLESIRLEEVTLVGTIAQELMREHKKHQLELLSRYPQILVYDKRYDEAPDDFIPDADQEPVGQKIYVPDHSTKVKLIQGGVGWGRIATSEAYSSEQLVAIDSALCAPVHLELCLIRPRLRPIGPVARRIWKIFEDKDMRTTKQKSSRKLKE